MPIDWNKTTDERDCQGCPHSKNIGDVHRLCEHSNAPEKPPYKRRLHNAMAFYAAGPPDWCPLEGTP